jgi:hypothetical protein
MTDTVETTVVTDETKVVGFFEAAYAKILAEAKALESGAVTFEEAFKAKVEAFAAEVAAKIHGIHASTVVPAPVVVPTPIDTPAAPLV